MLDPIPLENAHFAAIHDDRKADDELSLGMGEDFMEPIVEFEKFGGDRELLASHC